MSCLDETTLWDLIEGRLTGPALERVDQHVDGCELCRSTVTALAKSEVEPPALPARGESVGRFIALDPLGRGAMGVVYAAYDPDLDRKVAIKIVRPDSFGGAIDGRERSLREAQAMAKLDHGNVVRVYEVGPHRGGMYLAMELVDGVSLRGWLDERRAPAEVLRVLVEAGRGLEAAHARGVVHRDFKPENVVVTRDGHAKVADFGLARADADSQTLGPSHTTGLGGTPVYMAPELLAGGTADARSDQFAFAVSAFEALYRRRPFEASTREELLASVARPVEVPRKPPVPARVRRALVRALATDRAARFDSMAELLRELDPPRRSRAAAWLVASAIAALAIGGFTVAAMENDDVCAGTDARIAEVWSAARAAAVRRAFERAQPDFGGRSADASAAAIARWIDELAQAKESACRATHVTRDRSAAVLDLQTACLDRQLDEVERLVASFERADARTVVAAAGAIADLPSIADCTSTQNLLAIAPRPTDASALAKLAELERDLAQSRVDLALGSLERADAHDLVARARETRFAPVTGEAELLAAALERRAAGFDVAEDHARRALFAFEEGRDALGVARAWLALVAVTGDRGDYTEAKALARHARAAVERAGMPASLESVLAHEIGIVSTNLGEYDGAATALARALALRTEALGEDDPEVSRVETSLGNLARSRGDLAGALAHHRRALAIDERALGPSHPAIGRHLHNLGGVLRLEHDLDRARDHYERALALREAALGPEHTDVAYTHNSLGLVCAELSDRAGARRHYDAALAIFAARGHADEAIVQKNLGLVDLEDDRAADALARFERARSISEASVGRVHRRTADAMLAASVAHRELGNDRAAGELLDEVQAIATALRDDELLERASAERAARSAREVRAPPGARVRPPVRDPPEVPAPAMQEARREDTPAMVCVRCSSATGYGPAQAWDDP